MVDLTKSVNVLPEQVVTNITLSFLTIIYVSECMLRIYLFVLCLSVCRCACVRDRAREGRGVVL